MAYPSFDEVPDYGLKAGATPNVLTAQFGDGYRQDAENGLNTVGEVITAQFTRSLEDAHALRNVLKSYKGAQRFWWHPPGWAAPMLFITTGEIGLVSNNFGQHVVSATFTQVFDPV